MALFPDLPHFFALQFAFSIIQKRTKLEGSGKQKWKKVMTKTGGKRLRVRVGWDVIGWPGKKIT